MANIPITADDLDNFFEPDEFAQEITIAGIGTFTAIVTDFYETDEAGTVGVESAKITIIVKTSDVPGIDQGNKFQYGPGGGPDEYEIVLIQPDNTGITRLQAVRV